MPYGLRDGLKFALVNERAIFLDVSADRYFCLPSSAERGFASLLQGGRLSPADQLAIEPLVRDGLLVTGAPLPPPDEITVVSDAARDRGCSRRVSEVVAAGLAQLRVTARLRSRSFSDLILSLQRRKQRLPARYLIARCADDEAQAGALIVADAFQRTNLVFAPHDRCLLRSAAMMDSLIRRGIHADFCIGVTLPFAAHCWVQRNGKVLSDSIDRVRTYTPILVV